MPENEVSQTGDRLFEGYFQIHSRFIWPVLSIALGLRHKHHKSLSETAGIREGDKVVEVGAGYPLWRYYSHRVGDDGMFVAVDIDLWIQRFNKKICAFLNRFSKYPRAETQIAADTFNLPFADSIFDLFLVSNLPIDSNYVNEAFRVLRVGGRILISCGDGSLRTPWLDELEQYCREAGFQNLERVRGVSSDIFNMAYNYQIIGEKR